ncbi:hypothetical protein Y032_0006g2966 [Ancylostoma ceylanicum]|nr:hypothetical protein Y032_0006g2966 [Ancylostoma ceylanicum]
MATKPLCNLVVVLRVRVMMRQKGVQAKERSHRLILPHTDSDQRLLHGGHGATQQPREWVEQRLHDYVFHCSRLYLGDHENTCFRHFLKSVGLARTVTENESSFSTAFTRK